jgi:amino acid adenylation domain-containing protein
LEKLERDSYDYKFENFSLNELKKAYTKKGIFADRQLFEIYKSGEIVAFAVAECFSDGINLLSSIDICRVFVLDGMADIKQIIKALIKPTENFYNKHGKSKFYIALKTREATSEDIVFPGIEYRFPVGRVIADKDGLTEYKKLITGNIVYTPRYYKLSRPQISIWNTEKMYPNTNIGNIAGIIVIKEKIDFEILEKSINMVLQYNNGLRMRITEEDGQPQQYISKYNFSKIDHFDFSQKGGMDALHEWDEYKGQKGFKFIDSDLFYFATFKVSDTESGFYIRVHHIIADAWTIMNILTGTVIDFYKHLLNGNIPDHIPSSYLDYVFSEETYENSQSFIEHKEFWKERFKTIPELTSIKTHSKGYRSTNAKRKTFVISQELTLKIMDFCRETNNSPFAVFMAAISMYLNRITAKKDVVIGTPVLNRSNQREKEIAGMFVGVVPLRLFVEPEMTFNSFIESITDEWKKVLKNQKYPYDLILKDFRETHGTNENLFDVALSFQNISLQNLGMEYHTEWIFNGHQTESLLIHLSDREGSQSFTMDLDYQVDLFDDDEIQAIFEHMHNLLRGGVENPNSQLRNIEMLSIEEKNKILYEFNNTKTDYPRDKTIHQLFEEQVEKTPDNVAVVHDGESLTYRQLNDRANSLAKILRDKGAGPDKIIAIIVDRSFEMVIGFLAILKAGGAYLPIDCKYPAERIQFMLEDCDINILLTKKKYEKLVIDFYKNKILFFEDFENSEISVENNSNLNKPNDLAYIMYTSGSTGNPKGAMIEHKNVVRLVKNTNYVEFKENDRILQTGAVVFDASTFEIWGSILNGLRLYLVDDSVILNADNLAEALKENQITTIWLTSPLFNQLSQQNPKMFVGVKNLLVGGDVLSPKHINSVKRSCPGINIINGYGPTENTTFSTCFLIDQEYEEEIPIGKPISNSTVYILDENDNLQPIGVSGELCVGGDGVGRGYLKRQELTDEKFRKNPFEPNDRIYRTGDNARWKPDGTIMFLGRLDNQVKIRGFRVELGEIESKLNSVDYIKEAVVTVKQNKNKDKYICAYIVADKNVDFFRFEKKP